MMDEQVLTCMLWQAHVLHNKQGVFMCDTGKLARTCRAALCMWLERKCVLLFTTTLNDAQTLLLHHCCSAEFAYLTIAVQ